MQNNNPDTPEGIPLPAMATAGLSHVEGQVDYTPGVLTTSAPDNKGMPIILSPMRDGDPSVGNLDDLGFLPPIIFDAETKQYVAADPAAATPEVLVEIARLNGQEIIPGAGITTAEVTSNLPDYVQNPSAELQNAIAEREATFFTPKVVVGELATDGDQPLEEGKVYVQKIGTTDYYVQTDADGSKKIVLPGGATKPKIDAETISQVRQAQEEINALNEAAGFPTMPPEQVLMALSAQAMRQRQMSSRYAPELGRRHPFEVASRVKAEHPNVSPNSRAFRQLVKKEMGIKRFGGKH